jgi:hypothetical protein
MRAPPLAPSLIRWTAIVVALAGAGCGRTPIPADEDASPGLDRGLSDRALPREARASDKEGPPIDLRRADGGCVMECPELCDLVIDCKLFPSGHAGCVSECALWGMPMRSCLADLLCAGSKDCSAAASCVTNPPRPDLVPAKLVASVKGSTVSYTFTVCNQGKGASDPYSVDLYYQSTVPPPPKQPGDQVQPAPALAAGDCASFQLQRINTPPGTSQSWVQVDRSLAIEETDESNNVAGPATATVQPPAKPDLMIKTFTATVSGSNVNYEVEVCNVGGAAAVLFRVDLYYNRLLAPGVLQIGDQNALILSLGAGACQVVKRSHQNAAVAIYSSWAFCDTLGTVQELSETNNASGPKVVTVAAAPECAGLCAFATGCGVFKVLEFQQCLTWCNSMSSTQRQCALAASKANSCAALKACSLPPPPPPPPPPWACYTLCNYLQDTCKTVPGGSLPACIGACLSLPSSKLQCALDGMDKQQCAPILLCLL